MKCPYCGEKENNVLESRLTEDEESIRRRRQCEACGNRYTTYERVEGIDLKVVKKDGRSEDFDREKIRKGLMKATWKRPISMEQIDKLIDDVEQKLRRRRSREVKSWEIGNMIMTRLKRLDEVSYMLFASVYRDLKDIEDFEKELKELKS